MGTNANIDGNVAPSLLPKLPEPIHYIGSSGSNDLNEMLLGRCKDLNIYINRLFANKRLQKSNVLLEWLDVSYRTLGGLQGQPNFNLTNKEISKRILPYSVDILNGKTVKKYSDCYTLDKPVIPEPLPVCFKRSDLNSPGQLEKDNTSKSLANSPPKLTLNTSSHNYNDPVDSQSETSIFSDTDSARTPDTPLFNEAFIPKSNYIKLKIIKENDDIFALKVNRHDLKSITDLKKFITAKFPYKRLHIKLRDFKRIDSPNYDFIQVLNESEKIILKAI